MFEKIKVFLNDVKVEMKKVTWPSRKDSASGAVAVIIFVLLISLFLGLVDMGLASLVGKIIK